MSAEGRVWCKVPFLRDSPPLFIHVFEMGFLSEPEAHWFSRCAGQCSQGSAGHCHPSPQLRLHGLSTVSSLWHGFCAFRLGFFCFVPGILANEAWPQPGQGWVFNVKWSHNSTLWITRKKWSHGVKATWALLISAIFVVAEKENNLIVYWLMSLLKILVYVHHRTLFNHYIKKPKILLFVTTWE